MQLFKPLASLRLTVLLLALAMALVLAGTFAQIDFPINVVQARYFHSFFAWVPLQTFLPRPAPGGHAIPGGFPILGGYSIGILLIINLLAAHGLRFKQTWRDLVLLPLLALMIVPLVVWQYKGTDWLFNFVGHFGIDLAWFGYPFFVWVVLLSALIGLPFYLTLFYLHGKRGGIIMIHIGILMLLVGEGITSQMQVESQMPIDVGSYAQYTQDIREVELAVVDPSPADHNNHVVIPLSMLRGRGVIRDAKLPFDIAIDDYFVNSDVAEAGTSIRATKGVGATQAVVSRPSVKGTDAQTVDLASAYVTLSKAGKSLGTYMLTVMDLDPRFAPINQPQAVDVDGKKYEIQLRFKRTYKPYTIHLLEFVHAKYTGTDVPKDFASRIQLVDPSRNENREIRIWMNHPLRYQGETFFQSSFKPGDRTSILLVVKNPALVFPYAACTITIVGLAIHFCLTLANFLRKRSMHTSGGAAEQRGSSGKRPAGVSPAGGWAIGFPAGVVLCGVLAVIVSAIPRSSGDKFDLDGFGELPVSSQGRLLPFDTLARNSIKMLRGKEYLDDKGAKIAPARFLLDTFIGSEKSRGYKVFRIDNPDLKSLLSLKDEERYFSIGDLLPNGAKFEAQYQALRDIPHDQQPTMYQQAVRELGNRLITYEALARLEGLHIAAPTEKGKDWGTLEESIQNGRSAAADNSSSGLTNPSADAFVRMVRAYHEDNADSFNRAVADYRAAVDSAVPGAVRRASLESWYNGFSPFFLCCILYVTVFVLAAGSWVVWSKPLARAAYGLLILTFIVHSVGIASRLYLTGRGPVTNLASASIFIGWMVALLAILLELIYRNGVGSVVGGAVGFVALTLYLNLATDDTLQVLQAVLDTNFWLWTHVPSVAIGYSATVLAGFIGIVYIVLGLFTSRLNKSLGKDLIRMVYGITCFAIIFSFLGTVLGGIWADQSWGRFWGWDPKENGAVLIVIANALLLHARWGGLVKDRGVAALAVFGNIVTAFSFFGTNMLGIGLHSYGFMQGAVFWLSFFILTQLVIIIAANVPMTWWRSCAALNQPSATSIPRQTAIATA
jgi:ABC-type transport system involved in cytochrome c biogenesis permease subunit